MKIVVALVLILALGACTKDAGLPVVTRNTMVPEVEEEGPMDYRSSYTGTYYCRIVDVDQNYYPMSAPYNTYDTTQKDIVVKMDSLSSDGIYVGWKLVKVDSSGHSSGTVIITYGQGYVIEFRNDSLIANYHTYISRFSSNDSIISGRKK